MSAPLPAALRKRFQRYIEEGLSGRAAALRLKVSPATGARWARQVRTKGHAGPAPQGPPRDALADAEGVRVHHSSIANLLSRLGFTYKKSRWSPPSAAAPR